MIISVSEGWTLLDLVGFPGGTDGKEYAWNAGYRSSIPGLGRFPRRREWQPTMVFLPGEFRGWRSLVDYIVHGVAEWDMTGRLTHLLHLTLEWKEAKVPWNLWCHMLDQPFTSTTQWQENLKSEILWCNCSFCYYKFWLQTLILRNWAVLWVDVQLPLSFWCKVLAAHLCLTLCDPVDCSRPGSSIHGILQARTLEWVAIPFSGGSFWPRDWTPGLRYCRQILYHLSHQM